MSTFTTLIYQYGLAAMFIMILLEYACFPVSSEIILPFSGAVASLQHTSFFVIIPLSVIAGLIGTSLCYFLGRYGGTRLINAIKHRYPKTQKGLDNSYEKFSTYGPKIVCIGRCIPICRTYIAFIAGAVKLNYVVFLVSSAVGITVWNIILIGFGYILRDNWELVGEYYARYKQILLPVLVVVVVVLVFKFTPLRKLFRKEESV